MASTASAAPKSLAFIAVDVKTGDVLLEKDAYEPRHPASLTKMMTLYMLFDELKRGTLTLNSRLDVSARAAAKPASKLYVKAGSTISVEDAIKALAIKSANDVAVVVAENLAGSEYSFAKNMTRAARQLGMEDTTFTNASGLHNERQVTTAYDMYRLGLALQDRFPRYYSYFGKPSFKYGNRWIGGHNPFLGEWRGVDGIKTGYTRASGFNLVTNLKRDGQHIVAVVVGAHTSSERNKRMAEVLGMSAARASSGRRTLAKLDQSISVVNRIYAAKAPASSLRPFRRPAGPVLIAKAEDSLKPRAKPAILSADEDILFAANDEVRDLMRREIAGIDDEPRLTISTKSPPKALHLSFTGVVDAARPDEWRADTASLTSNILVSEAVYTPVDCLRGDECFFHGVKETEGGHFKVSDPATYAMITEGMAALP